MGKSDVRAGGAFIEIMAKANVAKGLKAAGAQVTEWGRGLATVGAGIMAASGAVLAPLAAMAHEFAETGSTLNDMSARTGLSAEALSGLGYAAQMTGADLDTVETANKKISQALAEAASGSATAQDKFRDLGIDWQAMLAGSPDDYLFTMADALAKIDNPAQRSAAALDLMGKSGTKLIPMLADGSAGLEEMMMAADKFGATMSNADAAAADELGDALDNLTTGAKGVRLQIGAALAPALTALATQAGEVIANVIEWTRNNRGLFVSLAIGAAAVGALGLAVVTAGGLVAGFGLALSALGALAGTIGAALVSPFGLVAGALAAGAYTWATYTESGQTAVAATGAALSDLATTASTTFSGIGDAVAAGDLGAAADIAMAGLRVAWIRGLQLVEELTGDRLALLLELLGSGRFGDAAALAWESIKVAAMTGWANLQAELATVSTGLAQLWDEAANGFRSAWQSAVAWVAGKLVWLVDNTANSLDLLAKAFKRFEGMGDKIRLGPGVVDAINQDAENDKKQRAADLAARTEARGLALAAEHKRLEDEKAAIAERRAKIEQDLAASTAGHGADALDAAQAELEAKTAAAKEAKEAKAAEAAGKKGKAKGGGEEITSSGLAVGTFSAAGAVALGMGGNAKDAEIADNTADTVAELRELKGQVAQQAATFAQTPAAALAAIMPPAAALASPPPDPHAAAIEANTAATAAACATLASRGGAGPYVPAWR